MPPETSLSRARLTIGRACARLVAALTRWSGRGGGTTLPGRVLLSIAPSAVGLLGARLPQGSALVSATNGKTTTTAMAAAVLAKRHRLAHNRAGANLVSGIASTLVAEPSAELGLLEVDEAALPRLSSELQPRALVLGNLFRDQLDRYGELETIADSWRDALSRLDTSTVVLANGDDPRIVDVAAAHPNVRMFGLDDPNVGTERPAHASDARTCFACGEPLEYTVSYVGHLGEWQCSSCDVQRPQLDYRAEAVEESGLESVSFTLTTPEGASRLELAIPGLYNVYNALAAATLAHTLGVEPDAIAEALVEFRPAFGRLERIRVGEKSLLLLLAKNPAGANEVVRTLVRGGATATTVIALNDEIADGRDVSWIWDVDFENLMPHTERVIATGSRAEELALRFKYGGYPPERLEVERELERALDRGLELTAPGQELIVIPTYTAMLALQGVLTDRGLARPYWERQNG